MDNGTTSNGSLFAEKNKKLLYVWVDNYEGILTGIGLNLSSDWEIIFEDNKLETIKIANAGSLNFWGEKIIDVKAIIGKNGTGKTSLLSFLSLYLFHPLQAFGNSFSVWEIGGKIYI